MIVTRPIFARRRLAHRGARRAMVCVGLLFVVTTLVGCNSQAGSSSTQPAQSPGPRMTPVNIVCTTGMVADLVRQVGGERVQVTQLMGEGVDPHLYKASTGDMQTLAKADAVFYSGLHLEGRMGDFFVRLARKTPTFPVTSSVAEEQLLELGEGHFDPHVWFDVSLWRQGLGAVQAGLAEVDPEHAPEFEQRAAAYRAELAELHAWISEQFKTLPTERRVLVTAHDAFHYFGRAYGLDVRAIQGVSTETEAGVKEINDLVAFLVERKIPAVFVESSVSDRNVQALVEGCRAQGHAVAIGGELFSDAMGRLGTPEGEYPGMIRHNVRTILKALRAP